MSKVLLRKWLGERGYELVSSSRDEFSCNRRTVSYNKRLSKDHQIYTILHECGHLILLSSESYNSTYKIQSEAIEDGRVRGSLSWRINLLKEEFHAWDEGKKLAKQLGIFVDEKKYDKYSSRCLRLYCMWVVEPHKFKRVG